MYLNIILTLNVIQQINYYIKTINYHFVLIQLQITNYQYLY